MSKIVKMASYIGGGATASVLDYEVSNPYVKTLNSDLIATLSISSYWEVSSGTNGYARDTLSGFTIQWGKVTGINIDYEDIYTGSWPRTFTQIFSMVANTINTWNWSDVGSSDAKNHDGYIQIRSLSTSSYTIFMQEDEGDDVFFEGFYWIAVGIS